MFEVEVEDPKVPDGEARSSAEPTTDSPTPPTQRCRYTSHSLRATTATLLDEAGVGIKKIQDLLTYSATRTSA